MAPLVSHQAPSWQHGQAGSVTLSMVKMALTRSYMLQGSDADEEVTVQAESFDRQQGASGMVQLQIGEAVGLEALTSGCCNCTARAEGDALFLALDGAALRSAPRCRSALQALSAVGCYRSIVSTRCREIANCR